jgi:hypothetical protein
MKDLKIKRLNSLRFIYFFFIFEIKTNLFLISGYGPVLQNLPEKSSISIDHIKMPPNFLDTT